MFKDVIKELMKSIMDGIRNLSDDGGLLSSITRNDVYISLWQQVEDLSLTAFKTLSLSILIIFILVEFVQISDRYSSNQMQDLIKPTIMITAKLSIAITVINKTTEFIKSIYGGFLDISKGISLNSTISIQEDLSAFNSAVDEMNLGTQLVCMIILFISALGVKGAWAMIQILSIGRFIQIYIYTAVAPAPIATIINRDWSYIGKGFIKSYISICLQGCILVLILFFFPTISKTIIKDIIPSGEGMNGVLTAFGNLFVMISALIVGLKNSKTMADKICGA